MVAEWAGEMVPKTAGTKAAMKAASSAGEWAASRVDSKVEMKDSPTVASLADH